MHLSLAKIQDQFKLSLAKIQGAHSGRELAFDDSGAFMLFMDNKEDSRRKATVKLGIFGVQRNRRAAELKVMSTVEGKSPGFFTKGVREGTEDSEWGTDIFRFRGTQASTSTSPTPLRWVAHSGHWVWGPDSEEFSYALGKDGTTKRKLARASVHWPPAATCFPDGRAA